MKKSSKMLVGGLFLIIMFLGAGFLFEALGLTFGPFQMIGSAVAGLAGALKLVS